MKKTSCPVCLGARRLRGKRRVGLRDEEFESKCWACRGSGEISYDATAKTCLLSTIVPEPKNVASLSCSD